ncbi:MAG: oligosaccharide flippase family protein [Phycisphaeraceae bacterium]|nr:oligosaccharide flippase family protein [Phycisphaeraceae bacterium]
MTSAPTPPPDASSLRRIASRGSMWTLAESLSSKVLSLTAQLILAWELSESEMGVANQAVMAASFLFLANAAAVSDLLTARTKGFRRWARVGNQLSLYSGLGSFLLVMALGPLVAMLYAPEDQTLTWYLSLLAVAALRMLFYTLACATHAQLRVDFRFRAISLVHFLSNVFLAGGSLLLALLDAGSFALVGGLTIGAVVRWIGFWWFAGAKVKQAPRSPPVKLLFSGLGWLLAAQYIATVAATSGVLILGLYADASEVGIYAVAFNLSYQVTVLFSFGLGQVLQPVLGVLSSDSDRQAGAFIRASGVILLLAIPLCLIQAALSEPLLRFAFPERWLPSAWPLLILSAAQAMAISQGPTLAMLKAQRRFRILCLWQGAQTLAYITLLVVLCPMGGAMGASVAMLVQFTVFGPIGIWLAIRVSPKYGWSEVAFMHVRPALIGLGLGVAAWWSSTLFPATRLGALAALMITGFGSVAAMWVLFRFFTPKRYNEIIRTFRGRSEASVSVSQE